MLEHYAKLVGDFSSVSVAVSTLIGLLPPIAALFTIVWTGIQIYEWYKKRKN